MIVNSSLSMGNIVTLALKSSSDPEAHKEALDGGHMTGRGAMCTVNSPTSLKPFSTSPIIIPHAGTHGTLFSYLVNVV